MSDHDLTLIGQPPEMVDGKIINGVTLSGYVTRGAIQRLVNCQRVAQWVQIARVYREWSILQQTRLYVMC